MLLKSLLLLSVAALVSGQAIPEGWHQAQLERQQQYLNFIAYGSYVAPGRRKRSLPVPGTAPVAGLGSGTVAEAQWYQQQLQWQQTQLNALARGKRSPQGAAAVPVTPGNIPGLVPGSAAAAQWWAQQIAHQGYTNQIHLNLGRKKRQAASPVTPGNIPGLVPGSAAAAQWWAAQIAHQGYTNQIHLNTPWGRKKRQAASPVTPGNIPGLVPGSAAAAQWWAAQIAHQGYTNQIHLNAPWGRKKRSLPAPGTAAVAGLGSGTVAEAQWYQQQLQWQQDQLNHIAYGGAYPQLLQGRKKRQAALPVTPGNIPGLVPGSAAAAAWWNAQLIHQQQLAYHNGK